MKELVSENIMTGIGLELIDSRPRYTAPVSALF